MGRRRAVFRHPGGPRQRHREEDFVQRQKMAFGHRRGFLPQLHRQTRRRLAMEAVSDRPACGFVSASGAMKKELCTGETKGEKAHEQKKTEPYNEKSAGDPARADVALQRRAVWQRLYPDFHGRFFLRRAQRALRQTVFFHPYHAITGRFSVRKPDGARLNANRRITGRVL